MAGPCLDQRSVYAEVLIRQQIAASHLIQHLIEELLGDVPFHQPFAILAEHCRHPHRLIHVQAHKPPEQQVVPQLLHQHPLAPRPRVM